MLNDAATAAANAGTVQPQRRSVRVPYAARVVLPACNNSSLCSIYVYGNVQVGNCTTVDSVGAPSCAADPRRSLLPV